MWRVVWRIGLLWMGLGCSVRAGVPGAPDWSALDLALVGGEAGEARAAGLATTEEARAHLVDLLGGLGQPGEPSARAWGAYHVLLGMGEPARAALSARPGDEWAEELGARIGRRLRGARPSGPAAAVVCDPPAAPAPWELGYRAGIAEQLGRVTLTLAEPGAGRVLVERVPEGNVSRPVQLTAVEASFLVEKLCQAAPWELPAGRALGAPGEDRVTLSFRRGEVSWEFTFWGEEFRRGPTRSLFRGLEAVSQRAQSGGLLSW